ncbi:MAG: hypothetical protein ETSY1_25070 [Candidatus Entotheonella factor]|uniref:Fatty acid desaturase domain-containing protein n=1 Tax=Entotheonella factor TaxID=1429438 RepID=W4LGK3_ENTF1|nr:acyl-CoA desaturase [Candidatus Entotheonella palauensis]ETW96820.1 MAG: hypothetical protein ETSY1_25070 [Candidatus Entotheonella factor]
MDERRLAARRFEQRLAMGTVLVPLLGVVTVCVLAWSWGVSALDLSLCGGMFALSSLGVTTGFHRLFTHGSFKARRGLQAVLAVAGSMSAQGPLLFWAAAHRRHHQYSDQAEDPHSPRTDGVGLRAYGRGLWHAHVGWMFRHQHDDWGRYVPDLLRDRMLFDLSQTYFVWVGLGILLPGGLGGLFSGTWQGALSGALWGGLVRIFLVHHTTWSVNSICHMLGQRPYATHDHSTNHWLCALLTFGEGWHNNHHAFPTSARHGLAWWEMDITYWLIRMLQAIGLVWDVKCPDAKARAAKRQRALGASRILMGRRT